MKATAKKSNAIITKGKEYKYKICMDSDGCIFFRVTGEMNVPHFDMDYETLKFYFNIND